MNTDQAVAEIIEAVKKYAVAVGAIYDIEGFALEDLRKTVEDIVLERANA